MDLQKAVKAYAKHYRKALTLGTLPGVDVDAEVTAYENRPRHLQFVRHSDLSEAPCCHNEILNRRRTKG